MKNALEIASTALKKDAVLFSCLPNIYDDVKGEPTKFPRATMREIVNEDDEFADDEPGVSDIVFRIDLWSRKNNLFNIAKEVKRVINATFSRCIVKFGDDMYEEKDKIHHKPINIEVKIEQEENE